MSSQLVELRSCSACGRRFAAKRPPFYLELVDELLCDTCLEELAR